MNSKTDCYSAGERGWMEKGQRIRQWLFEPLLRALARLQVSPDHVTLFALVAGGFYVFLYALDLGDDDLWRSDRDSPAGRPGRRASHALIRAKVVRYCELFMKKTMAAIRAMPPSTAPVIFSQLQGRSP